MENTQHLHQQIERATTRLAQLKARDLLTQQRAQAREREDQRKRQIRRRSELGQLVIDAGGKDLANGEIIAALLGYRSAHRDTVSRSQAMARGDAHLAALATGCATGPS